MMKIKSTLYLFAAALLTACSADDADWRLTPEQQSLMGQGVSFSASMAEPFRTRATYRHDGSFNEGDQMRIFRQYAAKDGSTFLTDGEIFRTYYHKVNYAAGTSVSLDNDWLPMEGKLKSDLPGKTEKQDAGDSLTWENGQTVRFRAWGRSNLSGALNSGTKGNYYPDYTVSDWVTVSGPTQNIPLTMRHIACRIGLTNKDGNQFSSATICTDSKDYEKEGDLAQVMAVYNKMCMPAGVDDKTFLLTAMTTDRYDNTTSFEDFEKDTTGIVKIGDKDSSLIRTDVQRPVFNGNNGRLYLMSIPFDMSKEDAGKEITLPACTRFKVWLYDVNNGDRNTTNNNPGSESNYHIFALSDIKDAEGNAAYPNGLTLKAGYSYLFNVGYRYDHLTITASDNFSWEEQDLGLKDSNNEAVQQNGLDFSWWTNAYIEAANKALNEGKDFLPEFSIADQAQFLTFIKLVNGTAATRMSGLKRGDVRKDENGFETYWWILENGEQITKEDAEKLGYVFYPHFYPTVSTQKAHVIEDYVQGPMDFYDTDFGNRYKVNLMADLDLYDWELPSIGEDSKKPFRGNFLGNGHTLRNVNMTSGYLFDHVMDGAITNLKIESTHPTCLLNTAVASGTTGWGCYIAGISMLCPSTTNSIATSLTGASYVVGCIHVGDAGGALVGSANNLTMLGCMQAAAGIPEKSGALLGGYASGAKAFFAPQSKDNLTWGSFMCNYYDVEKSPMTNAVGSTADAYLPQQYIRGRKSHILKAKNDYLLGAKDDYDKLTANMKLEIYGLAPWKAMNYAIAKYNESKTGQFYPCEMQYKASETGYSHLYPALVSGAPKLDEKANPLKQNN